MKMIALVIMIAVGGGLYYRQWARGQALVAGPRVQGLLERNINGAYAAGSREQLVLNVALEPQAFAGSDVSGTKENIEKFAAQLNKKLVGYRDSAAVRRVLVVPGGKYGLVQALVARLRVGSVLNGVEGVQAVKFTDDWRWVVDLKTEMYMEGVNKRLAPVIGKYELAVKYPGDASVPEAWELEMQLLADFEEPSKYAAELLAANPGKVRQAGLYLRRQKPDNSYELVLYRMP